MKNIANYHTHTELCKHASGRPEDYVRQAAREGCSALGFSDHCPYPASCTDIWEGVRMDMSELPLYRRWVEEAAAIAPFPVIMGFECEWDAAYRSWYEELHGTYGARYLVLGPHWVTQGTSHVYCTELTAPELGAYIDQTIDGMRSGLFAYLAHPDLFMRGHREWDAEAQACLGALLDAAVDLGMPLEVNGLGMSRPPNETSRGMRYQYPYAEFWELVAARGARVICNSDAHDPHDVLLNAWKARDFAGRFGITPLESLQFN